MHVGIAYLRWRENVPSIPCACAPAILRIWQEAHGTGLNLNTGHQAITWTSVLPNKILRHSFLGKVYLNVQDTKLQAGIAWLCIFSLLAHSDSKRHIKLSIFFLISHRGAHKIGAICRDSKLFISLWVLGTHSPWSIWVPEHWEWVPSLMSHSWESLSYVPRTKVISNWWVPFEFWWLYDAGRGNCRISEYGENGNW